MNRPRSGRSVTTDEGGLPRVMLVDDHPAVLVAFRRMLQLYCDVIASVGTGTEGVDVAVRLIPDILVVDLMLPDIDGLDVCRRVKKACPDTDVIIVTAFDDASVRSIAFRQGASAFVPKSWATATLGPAIEHLGKNRARRAAASDPLTSLA